MIKRKPRAPTEMGRITIGVELSSSARRTDGVARTIAASDHEAITNYLTDMIIQLEGLARATNKDMLAYLLSMASVQAAAPEARWDVSNAIH